MRIFCRLDIWAKLLAIFACVHAVLYSISRKLNRERRIDFLGFFCCMCRRSKRSSFAPLAYEYRHTVHCTYFQWSTLHSENTVCECVVVCMCHSLAYTMYVYEAATLPLCGPLLSYSIRKTTVQYIQEERDLLSTLIFHCCSFFFSNCKEGG